MSDLPPDPAALTAELLTALTAEVRGLRTDVQQSMEVVREEGRGRKGSQRLARLTVVVALVVTAFFAKSYIDAGRVSCEQRATARSDARTGLVRLADALSKDDPHHPTTAVRAKIHARAVEIAVEAYPPLNC